MRSRINAGIVLGVAAVITALSLGPVPAGESASGTFQFGHFALYFLLAGALLLYFADTSRGHVEAVLAAGFFGLLIEVIQFQIPSRTFSSTDVIVNFLGASLVLLDHRSDRVSFIVEKEDEFIEKHLPRD